MEDKEPAGGPVQPAYKDKKFSNKHKKILIVVVILLLIGLIIWLWMACNKKEQDLERKNKDLQSEVLDLKKQLKDQKKSGADEHDDDEANACPAVSDDLKQSIQDAVASKNYAALQASMTDPVTVVYAATEFGGPKTPAEAVTAMDYLNNGTAPWDFNLPAAIIAGYADGDYEQYFPEGAFVGRASDDMVVSFSFSCGKINQIFISVQEEIL